MKISRVRWVQLLALSSLAVLLLVVVACGDDSDNGDATPTDPTETPAVTPTDPPTPEVTGTPDNGEPTDPNGDANGDPEARADLSALSGMFSDASFSVTYQMSTNIDGEDISGDWTWFMDPANNRTRFDISGIADDLPGSVTVITTPELSAVCFEGACIGGDMPEFADLGDELFDQVEGVDDYALGGSVRSAGTMTIAGVTAPCFEFDNPDVAIETGTICFSPSGVPLLSEWSSVEGSFRMEAVSFSDSVSDSDFEPPYPMMDFPNAP